jgi:septum formation protein
MMIGTSRSLILDVPPTTDPTMPNDRVRIPELVLASRSPRRRELLVEHGYTFRVVPPSDSVECDASLTPRRPAFDDPWIVAFFCGVWSVPLPSLHIPGDGGSETPAQLVARLAWQKAADVAGRGDSGLIVGCDTVAECLGQILGKPRDRSHARQMLSLIRGREHRVLSGLCVWDASNDRYQIGVAATRLIMESIADDQLQDYLDSGDWQGKAGAFGYQDGHDWLRILEGSESNVVGLPMELLAEMLDAALGGATATAGSPRCGGSEIAGSG